MVMSRAEQRKKTKLRQQKHRDKQVAEGKKKYEVILDMERQEDLESIKEMLLHDSGKEKMSQSEVFQTMISDFMNLKYNYTYLEDKNKELENEYTKLADNSKKLLVKYNGIKKENESLKKT